MHKKVQAYYSNYIVMTSEYFYAIKIRIAFVSPSGVFTLIFTYISDKW